MGLELLTRALALAEADVLRGKGDSTFKGMLRVRIQNDQIQIIAGPLKMPLAIIYNDGAGFGVETISYNTTRGRKFVVPEMTSLPEPEEP